MKVTHDLHLHSALSACCHDPEMTPDVILHHGIKKGYDTICITDHCWDSAVPGASPWYTPQNIAHVLRSYPLPEVSGIRFCLGCETEYCGGEKLALSKEAFGLFDFVAIPVNHFHMTDYTCPANILSPEDRAMLMMERLEELAALPLPWQKIGIAHFTCKTARVEGELAALYNAMPAYRLRNIFDMFAKHGAGIELNACGFPKGEDVNALHRPYIIAREAGCHFYFASDAHRRESLNMDDKLAPVIQALALGPDDIFTIPVDTKVAERRKLYYG